MAGSCCITPVAGPVMFLGLGNQGRLGNQLFQIASTIGIATRLNMPYAFNTWAYEYAFNTLPRTSSRPKQVHDEQTQNYYPVSVGANTELKGYYQSELYFQHVEDHIRNLFTFSPNIHGQVRASYQVSEPFACIHIRRTDYVDIGWYPGDAYYLKALQMLSGYSKVYVLSDDIGYARELLGEGPEYVVDNELNSLFLMTQASAIAISNSSFSWWGAWLGKTKRVYYPDFYSEKDNFPNKNFYPARWHKLKA